MYNIISLIIFSAITINLIFFIRLIKNKKIYKTNKKNSMKYYVNKYMIQNHPKLSIAILISFYIVIALIIFFPLFYHMLDDNILDFLHKYETYIILTILFIIIFIVIVFVVFKNKQKNKILNEFITIKCEDNIVKVEVIKKEFNYILNISVQNNTQKDLRNVKIKMNKIYLNNYETIYYDDLSPRFDLYPSSYKSRSYEFNLSKNEINSNIKFTNTNNIILDFNITFELRDTPFEYSYYYKLIENNKNEYTLKDYKIYEKM